MRTDRALLASLAVLGMAAGAVFLRQNGPGIMPACLFRSLTDLQCPLCGMTRATHALLHGKVSEAFHFNALGMVLFPIALIALAIHLLGWVRGKPLPISIMPGRWGAPAILIVVIGWFVWRNVW